MNILQITEDDLTNKIQSLLCDDENQDNCQKISCLGPTHVSFINNGVICDSVWQYETNLTTVLKNILKLKKRKTSCGSIDSLQLTLTYHYQEVEYDKFDKYFANIYRGIRGIEIQYNNYSICYTPCQSIATNRPFKNILTQFLQTTSTSVSLFKQRGIIHRFQAYQFLAFFSTGTKPKIISVNSIYRGNKLVKLNNVDHHLIGEMTTIMGTWLINQVQSDGRMIYKYFPSRGNESTANNMIRQFMATLALIRYAKFTQSVKHLETATLNLNYNLRQFYHSEGNLGIIEYDNKVKLGALALVALAILEHPHVAKYKKKLSKIGNTIQSLWREDGSFRTFYKPSQRNDNQNFYPGEALLFAASFYQSKPNKQLLDKCYQSFYYYREWHRNNPNPAFIPWHTQAYTILFEETKDTLFLEFIFEMNDWLIHLQQWENVVSPDIKGRFYSPQHPEYGPPHASSTGVYLEGLADAYRLANQVGDKTRAQLYQKTILRGIRSLRQLQFKDELDMFYISKKKYVLGGLRTTVYDNTIRVDNVQHGLMALLKLSQIQEFFTSRKKY